MNPSMFFSATTLWCHNNALHSFKRVSWKRSYLQICHAKACLAVQTEQVLHNSQNSVLSAVRNIVFEGLHITDGVGYRDGKLM